MSVNRETVEIINAIAEDNGFAAAEVTSLAGGDINRVFLIKIEKAEDLVVKLNNAEEFPKMFEAEKAGLEALAAPEVIDVPKVISTGTIRNSSYLLLEYKKTSNSSAEFDQNFGEQLAALHRNSAQDFGFKIDNYIGSLPQQNKACKTASEFYITQRLEPQFALAKQNHFDLGNTSGIFKTVEALIPQEPPALVHGDLWSGNYLVNSAGNPCLIDPAVAYAPREIDLGMMKLFGGFSPGIFKAYYSVYPPEDGFEERIPLWQLYYLLVHLNIFGEGFKYQVISILRHYS